MPMENLHILFKNMEKEFNILQQKIKTYYLVIISLYFLPVIITIFVFSKFFQSYYNITVKIVILIFTIGGGVIHFYVRNHHRNNVYKKFFDKRLITIKTQDKDTMNKSVIPAIRYIIDENSVIFLSDTKTTSNFWNFLLHNLNLTKADIHQE